MRKYERATARRITVFTCVCMALLLAGCDIAPNEAQKQNVWLHNRTATVTAETARAENASGILQALTQLGDVYGTRAVRFLPVTRSKSQALQEIIAGNELFKKQNQSRVAAFKQAHRKQSPLTRQIVAQAKTQAVPESRNGNNPVFPTLERDTNCVTDA